MKFIFSSLLLLFTGVSLWAQNSTNSPYSRFGIGELEISSGGRSAGMGQTGIALRSNVFFNSVNPAALTEIEPQSFMLDMGFNLKYTHLENVSKSTNANNGNLSWVQIGFPISKKFFGGLTINPRSAVGYKIFMPKTVEGTFIDYPSTYEGTGGLSEASGLLAWKINKYVSLGGKVGYMWGNVTESIDQYIDIISTSYEILQENNIHYSGGYFNFGTQIKIPVNSKSSFILGGIAGLSSSLNADQSTNITKTFGSVSEIILTNSKSYYSKKLPVDVGVGISYQYGKKWLGTFDVKQSNWNDANLVFDSNKLTKNNSYRGGLEYAPKEGANSFRQTAKYRIGYRYESGYLKIYDTQISEKALSVGFGMPIRRDKSFANFSLEFGTRGTTKQNLVKENFVKFSVSLNLYDRWFFKRQID
jgi:hypothetical protein